MKRISPVFKALFATDKLNSVPGNNTLIQAINHQALLILLLGDMQDLYLPLHPKLKPSKPF